MAYVRPLLGVVKDDAQRVSMTRMKATDTVPQTRSIDPVSPAHGTAVDGENDGLTLHERNDFSATGSSRVAVGEH